MNREFSCLAVLLSSLFVPGISWSGGTDEGMTFVDLTGLSRSDAASAPGSEIGRVLPLRSVDRAVVSDAFDSAVTRMEIDAARLVPFRSGAFRLSTSRTVVRLTIGALVYDLAIVDVTFDRSFGLHHVGALVLGTNDGYARFTVSLVDGTVIGTVYASGRAWRIAPAGAGGGHLIRPIRPATEGTRNDVKTTSGAEGEASLMEARHVQMLRVAELRPLRFHTRDSGPLVSITAPEVERIDLRRALILPPSGVGSIQVDEDALVDELTAAVQRMQPLTMRSKPVELEVQSLRIGDTTRPSDLVVRVAETIDGIPVEPGGVMVIDTASGRIRHFALIIVPPGVTAGDASEWLTAEMAEPLARQAIAAQVGGPRRVLMESELRYLARSESEIAPEWMMHFGGPNPYSAVVDAKTGKTEVYKNYDEGLYWGQTICTANGQDVTKCDPPAVDKVTDFGPRTPEGVPRCTPVNACEQRYLDAFETVEAVEDYLASAGRGDWGYVDVISDLPGTAGAYDPVANAVRLPVPGAAPWLPGVDPLAPASKEALIHELIHRDQQGGPVSGSNPLLRSLKEGLADAAAAQMTGDWVVLDGLVEEQYVRDLTEAKTLEDYFLSTDPHRAGMVWGHAMYKLSTKPGVTPQVLTELILDTYNDLAPMTAGHPELFEFEDVYAAMIAVANGNSALQQSIYEAWQEIGSSVGPDAGSAGPGLPEPGTSGGIPPPGGAPSAPFTVDAYETGCALPAGSGYSSYNLFWSHVIGASRYEIYWSTALVGPYQYSDTVFGTNQVDTYNSVDAWVKVKACNGFGCSWLSVQTAFQLDFCPP